MTKEKSTAFKRPDGRKVDEMRKMSAKVGIVPNADGSAMFSFGDTIAIAAVYTKKNASTTFTESREGNFKM